MVSMDSFLDLDRRGDAAHRCLARVLAELAVRCLRPAVDHHLARAETSLLSLLWLHLLQQIDLLRALPTLNHLAFELADAQ